MQHYHYCAIDEKNCNLACGVIGPYNFQENYKSPSQVRQTANAAYAFINAGIDVQAKIIIEINAYRTVLVTSHQLLEWCNSRCAVTNN